MPDQILAELEIWHSRPITPTRRLVLGNLVLPVDPAPGFGGLLLGAVMSAHIVDVDEDLIPDVHRLITQINRDERVVQPRLRHRYQVDRHGLSRSVHRLCGNDEELQFNFDSTGSALQQVLGSVYALERLEMGARNQLSLLLHKSMNWRGQLGSAFISFLAGSAAISLSAMTDPRVWALDLLGFPPGTIKPNKKEIQTRFRETLRQVHPNHGGISETAALNITELGEARRVLMNL
ncbi:MAG: hypothetical protein ACYC0U_01665 [Ilumatobacteraceae bacterium]